MNEPKFTKGQWIYEEKYDIIHDDSEDEFNIASVREHWRNNEANVKLICAAPDMFKALQVFVENVENWLKTGEPASSETSKVIYEGAKNALKKAFGE